MACGLGVGADNSTRSRYYSFDAWFNVTYMIYDLGHVTEGRRHLCYNYTHCLHAALLIV